MLHRSAIGGERGRGARFLLSEEKDERSPCPRRSPTLGANELVELIPQKDEQSSSLVVAGVLSELAPQKEVTEIESSTGSEVAKALFIK